MYNNLLYKRFGAYSILIEWPQVIDETTLYDVLDFKEKIENRKHEDFVDITNAYNSLLINYYADTFDFEREVHELKAIYEAKDNCIKKNLKLWRIPVCYDTSFGIDLQLIAKEKQLPVDEIIKRHRQTIYTVYFIGFLPGFLYLGGLDASIFMPRKASPRLKINKGAVAIGGNQTGVYPNESPGGWNIIGNSPINFFNVTKTKPCFAKAGDKIEFYPVTTEKYKEIKILVEANVYEIENKAL